MLGGKIPLKRNQRMILNDRMRKKETQKMLDRITEQSVATVDPKSFKKAESIGELGAQSCLSLSSLDSLNDGSDMP